jgi:hypothetical protein
VGLPERTVPVSSVVKSRRLAVYRTVMNSSPWSCTASTISTCRTAMFSRRFIFFSAR